MSAVAGVDVTGEVGSKVGCDGGGWAFRGVLCGSVVSRDIVGDVMAIKLCDGAKAWLAMGDSECYNTKERSSRFMFITKKRYPQLPVLQIVC